MELKLEPPLWAYYSSSALMLVIHGNSLALQLSLSLSLSLSHPALSVYTCILYYVYLCTYWPFGPCYFINLLANAFVFAFFFNPKVLG